MIVAVCDDDSKFRTKVVQLVRDYFETTARKALDIIEFESGEQLSSYDGWVDIAFVDVEMEGISGICASQHLREKNNRVIIIVITAYDYYLDDAFRFKVFRYLSKPLSSDRFNKNLKDALSQYSAYSSKILLETKNDNITISMSDIIMVEAIRKKVIIYTVEGVFESIHNLKYWNLELEKTPCFYQTHKSFIVNFEHILEFTNNLILLNNGHKAYLTARKYTDFKHRYMMYLATTQF